MSPAERSVRCAIPLLVSALLWPAAACGDCNSSFLPRADRDQAWSLGADRPGVFADVRFEYQDWKTKDLSAAPDIGDGEKDHATETPAEDHGHNRARDEYTHLTLGANWSDSLTLFAHTAFVARHELTDAGSRSTDGFGDTDLVGIWRFLDGGSHFAGAVFGVKLPTGDLDRRDAEGRLLQPELQPGTGSIDTFLGPAFEVQTPSVILRGNALYSLRNGGAQDYTFGDSTSTSLFADYVVRQDSDWSLFVGGDVNLRGIGMDKQAGRSVRDSGGTILLVGPNVTLRLGETSLISAALLLPAFQDRGGEHQDLSRIVTVGGRILF